MCCKCCNAFSRFLPLSTLCFCLICCHGLIVWISSCVFRATADLLFALTTEKESEKLKVLKRKECKKSVLTHIHIGLHGCRNVSNAVVHFFFEPLIFFLFSTDRWSNMQLRFAYNVVNSAENRKLRCCWLVKYQELQKRVFLATMIAKLIQLVLIHNQVTIERLKTSKNFLIFVVETFFFRQSLHSSIVVKIIATTVQCTNWQ